MGFRQGTVGPKVLIFDIETSTIQTHTFGIRKQFIGVEQIEEDWAILSIAAKWLGEPKSKMLYKSQEKKKDFHDDKALCKWIWELLDESDVVITKNGKFFDVPKVLARFAVHRLGNPGPFRHYDVGLVAMKKFGFTSSKLEYLTNLLCPEYRKLKHGSFPGIQLWLECQRGNPRAWKEMKKYNCVDVLGTEAIYNHLSPYDPQINFGIYTDEEEPICQCGSRDHRFKGYYYTNTAKFRCYKCNECGAYWRDRKNLITQKQKQNLRLPAR